MLSYWERRQIDFIYEAMQSAESTADEISKLYLSSSGYISAEADKIFDKYRSKNHLSDADAKRLLNTVRDRSDIDEMVKNLANGDYQSKSQLIAEIEAPAYQARIERLKQLENQTDRIMKEVYKQEKTKNQAHYVDLANESYYKEIYTLQQQSGVSFSFSYVDPKQIDKIIHSNWSGKNYSTRIWGNTSTLAKTIKEELAIGLITGKTNREIQKVLQNKFSQGSFNAKRLVRTESNFVSNEMCFLAYKDTGIEQYRYMATLDLRTSLICRSLDNKVFYVKDRKVGVNCPPMHPWCRSTTVAIIDPELEKKLTRSARDPITGKVYKVPISMSYNQWYDKYVKGNNEALAKEKALKNRSSDQKQYDRYRPVVGSENIGKTFDDFQTMKYNEVEKWKLVKLDYARQYELMKNPSMKLPNADNAILPDEKFTKYLLGGSNQKGLAKGKAFTSRLGYDIKDWKSLQTEISKGVNKYPATVKNKTEFGTSYEQKMILYGKQGTPANTVVGWILRKDGVVSMTSAYIKEVN